LRQLDDVDTPINDAAVDAELFNPIGSLIGGAVKALVPGQVGEIVGSIISFKRSSDAGSLSLRQAENVDPPVDSVDTPIDDAAVDAELFGPIGKGLGFLAGQVIPGPAGKVIGGILGLRAVDVDPAAVGELSRLLSFHNSTS
jgi:hypothetical protein